MSDWHIHEAAVAEHYQVLHRIGCLGESPESGFLRAAYSDEETAAMKYIEERAVALGASPRWDKVGNLFLEWQTASGKFAEVGSHLDTVPFGGNFDGAAGIVAGLVAIEKILKNMPARKHGLRLRIWRGEESATFNTLFIGSLGAFGRFNAATLTNRFRGITLEDAMRSQGIDPEVLRHGQATISPEEKDSILAHVELHIEQGNLLEVEKKDIGIVTSIRGPFRLWVKVSGEFDHSGATPMGVKYRRDCNLALGYMMVRLDEAVKRHIAEGADLVQTIGVINSSRDINEKTEAVYQNAVPKVSGYAYFSLDIRSNKETLLTSYAEEAKKILTATAEEFGVTAEIETISHSKPLESMDTGIQDRFKAAANDLHISWKAMASGAGHDAATVGGQMTSTGESIPVGMLFIPCLAGKSHCPEEFATNIAIAHGASVVALALATIVRNQ